MYHLWLLRKGELYIFFFFLKRIYFSWGKKNLKIRVFWNRSLGGGCRLPVCYSHNLSTRPKRCQFWAIPWPLFNFKGFHKLIFSGNLFIATGLITESHKLLKVSRVCLWRKTITSDTFQCQHTWTLSTNKLPLVRRPLDIIPLCILKTHVKITLRYLEANIFRIRFRFQSKCLISRNIMLESCPWICMHFNLHVIFFLKHKFSSHWMVRKQLGTEKQLSEVWSTKQVPSFQAGFGCLPGWQRVLWGKPSFGI